MQRNSKKDNNDINDEEMTAIIMLIASDYNEKRDNEDK